MQHEFHAVDGSLGHREIREISLDELRSAERLEIASLAGNQAVDYADTLAALEKFLGEVRSDETRAAGDEIGSQLVSVSSRENRPSASPG
jgi:hypothetical protein